MGLRSGEEYIKGVLSHPREIYVAGEKVNNPFKNPVIKPVMNSISKVYDLTIERRDEGILTAIGFDGEEISRFLHIEQSIDDLLKRVEAMKIINSIIGDCNYRCTGHDALNALYSVTYEIDRDLNTEYHTRFKSYLKTLQKKDLLALGVMTDVKGDRSKGPKEQTLKDVYLHVVEERSNGIVVSGAKMHVSGGMVADELVVVPTRSLKDGEEEFAVAFAIPADTKGIYFISSWSNMDALYKIADELGVDIDIPTIYGHRETSLIVFDDVFIPRERIFMNGETRYTGNLVTYFIAHHRGGGAGCKAGFAKVITGAAALMADANGVLNARAIREKLTQMKYHGEASYAAGVAAASKGWRHDSGAYIPDITLSNVAKLEAVNHLKEVVTLAADIGGGIIVNAPSEKDLDIPDIGKKVENLLRGSDRYNTRDRLKIARLLQNWTAGIHLVGLIQGGGPPSTSLIFLERILRNELQDLLENTKKLAGISKTS